MLFVVLCLLYCCVPSHFRPLLFLLHSWDFEKGMRAGEQGVAWHGDRFNAPGWVGGWLSGGWQKGARQRRVKISGKKRGRGERDRDMQAFACPEGLCQPKIHEAVGDGKRTNRIMYILLKEEM